MRMKAIKKIVGVLIASLVLITSTATCFAAEDNNIWSITIYKYGIIEGEEQQGVENPVNDAKNVVSDSDFFGNEDNAEGEVKQAAVPDYNEKAYEHIPLPEAKFTLSYNQNGSSPINFVNGGSNSYTACFVNDCSEHTHITEITTGSSGLFTLDGLPSGTYYLTETQAPEDYVKLADPIKIIIADDGTISIDGDDAKIIDDKIYVFNAHNADLPFTGGIGFTIAYIICAVVVLALAVLITSKIRINKRRRDSTVN